MPGNLGGNLNLCFTKIKRPSSPQPKHHTHPLPNSTTSILIKNFNCLYELPTSNPSTKIYSQQPIPETETTTTPDFATAFASQRFFFSSPGRSNSITDSSSSSSSSSLSRQSQTLVTGSTAIPTFSPDPYMDFRRSMQEMVDSRHLIDVRANWDYLHELLTCYLSLNPKTTHKFIVAAFVDLLVSLMPEPPEFAKS